MAFRTVKVRFVHQNEVRQFEQTCFLRLHRVATGGAFHEHDAVGHRGTAHLGLTRTHRFDDDQGPAAAVEDLHEVTQHGRDAAAGAARCDRADVDAPGKGLVVGRRQSDAVPKQGAAGQRRRRVNGEQRHGFVAFGMSTKQVVDEAGFADAGRTGDGNGAPYGTLCAEVSGGDAPVLDVGQQAGEVPPRALARRLKAGRQRSGDQRSRLPSPTAFSTHACIVAGRRFCDKGADGLG